MKHFNQIAGAALLLVAAPAAVSAQAYDANPTVAFTYGSGNDYIPANAVVSTSTGTELAVRAHVPTEAATSTGGTGIYVFDLGSDVSFDFSFVGTALTGSTVTVTNLLTGDDATFAAALLGTVQSNGALQGSQQLGFGFMNGSIFASEDINFDANQNNTFQIDLFGGGQTLTAFAQLGSERLLRSLSRNVGDDAARFRSHRLLDPPAAADERSAPTCLTFNFDTLGRDLKRSRPFLRQT